MYNQAKDYVDHCSVDVNNMQELIDAINNQKVAMGYHCSNIECEEQIKAETGIQTRVIISECDENDDHKCIHCGKKAKYKIYFAKQY
mgnify:FL=1